MSEIKDKIVSAFGGVVVVAGICGITPGAVSQWEIIPASHQQTLLDWARNNNIGIGPADFFENSPPSKKVKKSAKK